MMDVTKMAVANVLKRVGMCVHGGSLPALAHDNRAWEETSSDGEAHLAIGGACQ